MYYKYKIYLLDCLANFHLPLWSPSEAAGFPFYTNPFAQVFYPFNALLVLWYKVFGGYSPLDHQLFTVLGISIFALGLFMWLKRINKDITAVVFAVMVMSVSFKITEIIRFPNAVHSAAWYPWILYAIDADNVQQLYERDGKGGRLAGSVWRIFVHRRLSVFRVLYYFSCFAVFARLFD